MAKEKITERLAEALAPFLAENGYSLFHSEFKKEGKDRVLRLFIEFAWEPGQEKPGYIGTEDCEKVSRYVSDLLDQWDPIEQNYTLEVSSPGLERPLRGMEDFLRFAGETAEISLYEPLNGSKRLQGVILAPEDGAVRLETPQGVQAIPLEKIAKAKLSIVF